MLRPYLREAEPSAEPVGLREFVAREFASPVGDSGAPQQEEPDGPRRILDALEATLAQGAFVLVVAAPERIRAVRYASIRAGAVTSAEVSTQAPGSNALSHESRMA